MRGVKLIARGRVITFPRRPLIMGIVNINHDSFSKDGTLDIDEAIARARIQVAVGADIVDVGGESARTNRLPITETEEIERTLPFVERFSECLSGVQPIDQEQVYPPLLSVNTWRPRVAETLLAAGADFLNDMSALPSDETAVAAAKHGAALVIMHSVGSPKQKNTDKYYADIFHTLETFFSEKIAQAEAAGVPREAIVLDPGIDFAKQKSDNLRIYRNLDWLHSFERPILLPVSRKTVIGEVLGLPDPNDRDAGTVACIVAGMQRGANIFRVHNVHAASQVIRTVWALR
jgi:dihydropteroate synthase